MFHSAFSIFKINITFDEYYLGFRRMARKESINFFTLLDTVTVHFISIIHAFVLFFTIRLYPRHLIIIVHCRHHSHDCTRFLQYVKLRGLCCFGFQPQATYRASERWQSCVTRITPMWWNCLFGPCFAFPRDKNSLKRIMLFIKCFHIRKKIVALYFYKLFAVFFFRKYLKRIQEQRTNKTQ